MEQLKINCMHEFYSCNIMCQQISYSILEENYSNALGKSVVTESVSEKIKDAFKKFIDFFKRIVQKIVTFVTKTLPNFVKTLLGVSKKNDSKEAVQVDTTAIEEKPNNEKEKSSENNEKIKSVLNQCIQNNNKKCAAKKKIEIVKATDITPKVDNDEEKTNEKKTQIAEVEKKIDEIEKKTNETVTELKEITKDASPEVKKVVSEVEKAVVADKPIIKKQKVLIGYRGILFDQVPYDLWSVEEGIRRHILTAYNQLSTLMDWAFEKSGGIDVYGDDNKFRDPKSPRVIQDFKETINMIDDIYQKYGSKIKELKQTSNFRIVSEGTLSDMEYYASHCLSKLITQEIPSFLNTLYSRMDSYEKKGILPKGSIQDISRSVVMYGEYLQNFINKYADFHTWMLKEVTSFKATMTPVYKDK